MNWQFPYFPAEAIPDWNALEAQFDWLKEMESVPQDPIWHAEGNVLIHTRMVVEALLSSAEYQGLDPNDQQTLFAAALLHDVEKRSTTQTEWIDGVERIVSPRHARKGEGTARQILYRDIPTPFVSREQICKLVRLHGLPLWAIEKPDPRKAVIEASLQVNTAHLALLARADVRGRISQDQEEMLLRIELFEELCREHECWGEARTFESDLARFHYLNRPEDGPDYLPFDDLEFCVSMMCALPGSGKDTYIKRELDLPVLSLDELRRKHKIDPRDKKGNGQMIQLGKEQARTLLRKRQSFVFNATNISRDMRARWTSLFLEYGAKIRIIYLEVPYQQWLRQNRNRTHIVPESVMKRMLKKLEIPEPSEAHELVFEVVDP